MDQKRRAKWELTSVRLTGLMDEGTRYLDDDDDASRRRVVDRLADTRTSPHLGQPPPLPVSLIKLASPRRGRCGDLIPCDVRNMERPPSEERDSHLEETFIELENRELYLLLLLLLIGSRFVLLRCRCRTSILETFIFRFLSLLTMSLAYFILSTCSFPDSGSIFIFSLFHPRNYYKLSLCAAFNNTFDNLWKSWRAYAQWRLLYKVQYNQVHKSWGSFLFNGVLFWLLSQS